MSEHESFAEAMECTRHYYPKHVYTELNGMFDRLQAAHDREIEAAYDPRRLRSSKDKSEFALAMEALREFRWQHATNDQEAIPYINAVEEAYKREVAGYLGECEECDMLQYREVMPLESERREAVRRLRELNLSNVVPNYTHFLDIAEALSTHLNVGDRVSERMRDRLVYLLGGDQSQDSVPMRPENETGSECNFSAPENDMDASDAKERPAETSDGEGGHVSLGTRSYLPKSPNKAIKEDELKVEIAKDGDSCKTEGGHGGTDTNTIADMSEKRPQTSAIAAERPCDVREEDDGDDAATGVHGHDAADTRAAREGTGEVGRTLVTAELREYVEENRMANGMGVETMWGNSVPYDLLAIADRIDDAVSGLGRDAELAKRMYAKACEGKCVADGEVEVLKRAAERDADQMESLSGQLEDMTAERDELQERFAMLQDSHYDKVLDCAALADECETYQDLLRDAARDYQRLIDKRGWDEATIDALQLSVSDVWERVHVVEHERDELQATVDAMRDNDAYRRGYDEGFASADDWLAQHEDAMAEHGWVKLPVDADGEPWHVGDESEYGEVVSINITKSWSPIIVNEVNGVNGTYEPSALRHVERDTPKSIVRALTLGEITESQAIGRIEALAGDRTEKSD